MTLFTFIYFNFALICFWGLKGKNVEGLVLFNLPSEQPVFVMT